MAEGQSQNSLKFRIMNSTRDTTLTYLRFQTRFCTSLQLKPELLPFLSDSCQISSDPKSRDIKQLVIYDAEVFILAIAVHISSQESDDYLSSLQLELWPDKPDPEHLDQAFERMLVLKDCPDSDGAAETNRELSGQGRATVRLISGSYLVKATLSHNPSPHLEVELQDWIRLW